MKTEKKLKRPLRHVPQLRMEEKPAGSRRRISDLYCAGPGYSAFLYRQRDRYL